LAERDRLLFGLEEIDKVAPAAGEDIALTAESARLAHADDLQAAAAVAATALSGDEGAFDDDGNVLGLLGRARKAVQSMAAHDDRLAELGTRLDELAMLTGDLAADLSGYVADTETDPTRLAAIGERRAALAALTRRYGTDVDAVLSWAAAAAERVAELDGSDERIAELTDASTRLRAELSQLASELHDVRVRAADEFAERAGAELRELAMPHARVEFSIEAKQDAPGGFGPDGTDSVELLLAPHPGAPARPLGRGASGGELSRVMLACDVVLGAGSEVPTYVFDEVDAGVGGAAAVEVGRRLAQLSRSGQVIVVTHLAQVAAFADRHYVVTKNSDGTITSSGLRRVEDADRVTELARMLAGDESSAVSQAHARELLDSATSPPTRDVIRPKRRRARRQASSNTPPGV
jgi:DNA repair protein RecN (Recombination protein N)